MATVVPSRTDGDVAVPTLVEFQALAAQVAQLMAHVQPDPPAAPVPVVHDGEAPAEPAQAEAAEPAQAA